jgi:PHP family Zn ribbon phosphoesterase
MNYYRADLHIHTVLSPCGDLEMSPRNIIQKASQQGLDIIGITDHNSTLQAPLITKMAREQGIFVLSGVEVTSAEEVHCLCFFEDDALGEFQNYIDRHLIPVPNKPEKLGHQVVVDEDEIITDEIANSLLSSMDQSIDQIRAKTRALNGIFIPAHINRPLFSIFSQLGFIPGDLGEDALEISFHTSHQEIIKQYPQLTDKTFISSSDAHYIPDIGKTHTLFKMHERKFDEIKHALNQQEGRKTII